MDNHTMEFPATEREINNWWTFESSVILQNHSVLVPEAQDRTGAVLLAKETPPETKDHFLVDAIVKIGNKDKTDKGGTGMALHYLSDFNHQDIGSGLFGYSYKFKGIAIYLNTLMTKKVGEEDQHYIQLFYNDGESMINPLSAASMHEERSCMRNLRNKKSVYLRLEYNGKSLKVDTFDMENSN